MGRVPAGESVFLDELPYLPARLKLGDTKHSLGTGTGNETGLTTHGKMPLRIGRSSAFRWRKHTRQ